MTNTEYILDFAVRLGARMLTAGANLERVNDTIYRVCCSYQLHDISLFSLSTSLVLSAVDAEGTCATRQISIPSVGIHLSRLNSYNQLARTICNETPEPRDLRGLLEEGERVEDYPEWLVLMGDILALGCICYMFGGSAKDIVWVAISTTIMFYILKALSLPSLNRVIKDAVCMFAAGFLAKLAVRYGLGENYYTIILTNAFLLIPGIPMVNSVRNILCGNELNGTVELMKVVLETAAIVVGLVIAIYLGEVLGL